MTTTLIIILAVIALAISIYFVTRKKKPSTAETKIYQPSKEEIERSLSIKGFEHTVIDFNRKDVPNEILEHYTVTNEDTQAVHSTWIVYNSGYKMRYKADTDKTELLKTMLGIQ